MPWPYFERKNDVGFLCLLNAVSFTIQFFLIIFIDNFQYFMKLAKVLLR